MGTHQWTVPQFYAMSTFTISTDTVITHNWPYNSFANSCPTDTARISAANAVKFGISPALLIRNFVHGKIFWCNSCKGHFSAVRTVNLLLLPKQWSWNRNFMRTHTTYVPYFTSGITIEVDEINNNFTCELAACNCWQTIEPCILF